MKAVHIAIGLGLAVIGLFALLNMAFNACGLAGMRDCADGSLLSLVLTTGFFALLALGAFGACFWIIRGALRSGKKAQASR